MDHYFCRETSTVTSLDEKWSDKSLYLGISRGYGYVEATPSCAFYHQGMAIVQGRDGAGFYSFIIFDAEKGFSKDFKRRHDLIWARIPDDDSGYVKKATSWVEIAEFE